jgi:DNA-directed RNA polymerase subunit alpha
MHIRWRGLELPSVVTCDAATLTPTYGKFVAEPFERGFGSTIGNGLRRVLLSSREGSAVTQIKVHNAQHEFTTIKGVLEDITDVVLNVKSLIVKNHSETTRVLRVEKNSAGPVLASDIETDEASVRQRDQQRGGAGPSRGEIGDPFAHQFGARQPAGINH